jgi:hypothetical protein
MDAPRLPPRLLGSTLVAFVALVAGAACSSSGGGTSTAGTSSGTVTTESVCDTDPRAMAYAAGMSETASTGSALKVSLVEAAPAPPAKGLNVWTIKIVDATGAPVSGATVALKPYMPDHGHGASVIPQVMPMSDAGTYQISDIDLFMPGIWQNTFTVTPASGAAESVIFTFCVDG